MFVLIWATLLLSARDSHADAGASMEGREVCDNGFCITLNEGEITAEAGLCVVIPCSFSTRSVFKPEHIVWFKCGQWRCQDVIFHSNKNSQRVQSGFKGRVSLLEPDVSQRNCSIIINDLTESDSGSYQLRVNGQRYDWEYRQWWSDGFTFSLKATVSVKDLTQKPTVMIPPLTEGQQSTLTCTAPGLCSGSDPQITWTWRGAGEKDSQITENIIEFRTEKLTAVTQRHSSTLTFNPSAEHHGSKVICKVSFKNNIITEETVTLNVTYIKEIKITGNTSVKEGETLNLTCSVDSFPPSLITWTKLSDKNVQNNTENYQQAESGTGTFYISNITAEDSGRYICTAKHLNNTWMKEVDVTVKYMKKPVITGEITVKEGHTLNLTCSVDSFPPSLITWTKLSDKNMQNETQTNMQNDTETYVQKESGTGTFSISNITADDSGWYICTAKYLNNTWMEKVDVTVKYMKTPVITGDTTVKEGHTLNLTCSVESIPPSHITWTVHGSNTNLHNEPNTDLQNDTGSDTLVIHNVTAEHSGQYICTAQNLDMTVAVYADVTVSLFPTILKNSRCVVQSDVLTCVCVSEGVPLPTIRWPLLRNYAQYSVITTVSNHTVNSTITLTVKDHSNTAVECVSSNEAGEANQNLNTHIDTSEKEEPLREELKTVSWPQVIIAFLIGVLLSAVCCLAAKCHRKKQNSPGNLNETLEMATSQEDPLIDAGQAVADDHVYYQDAAEDGGGAVAAEEGAPDVNGGPKDVEYASIDFSALKRRSPREAAQTPETTATEYAEIKKGVRDEREDDGGEKGEVLEDKEEEEMGEDKETKKCVPEEEEEEDMAVYSSVTDIMGDV